MWNPKTAFRNIILIICTFLLLPGCQKAEEKSKKTLKINFQEGDLPSLHPHALVIYLRGLSVAKNLFEGLTRVNEKGKAILAGASSYEVSEDHLCYTFVLRENHWSDGTPVTASHYEMAWKEALSPTSDCSRADLLYMIKNGEEAKKGEASSDEVGVKAIDEKRLFVELAYPSPYFLELLSQPIAFPLVEPKQKEPAQFNGPFVVDSWKRGDYLRLKPNSYFWNKDEVSLGQIEISMVEDTMTAYSLFEKEQIDWIGLPLCPLSVELVGRLKQINRLRSRPFDRAFWVYTKI